MLQFDEDGARTIMNELVRRSEQLYQCNRGPRPSGAFLYVPEYTWGMLHLFVGSVKPTEGMPSCLDVGCEMEAGHCVRNIHAEVDAVLSAAMAGKSTFNATMFSINKPCYGCMKVIAKAGIKTVYYAHAAYDEERTRKVAEGAGIKLFHVEGLDGSI